MLTIWSCKKKWLDQKDEVNFKIYGVKTSLTDNYNTHIAGLPNTSYLSNQIMKFGQLIECKKKNIFLKDHAENEAARLVSNLFLLFKKHYMRSKSGL